MQLPLDFKFTQSNLQDYVECARRFELRYLQRLQWPAVEAEPIIEREAHMRQGAVFHHLVHQHMVGVPEAILTKTAHTDPLRRWWGNYLAHGTGLLNDDTHPEITLTAPLGGYRLLAKYDVIVPGERFVIVDWKTAQYRPKRAKLAARLQTRVYAYMLVRAGGHLNGGTPISPEHVEMIYWFADDPQNPERFAYSEAQFAEDDSYLLGLVQEIENRTEFDLTAQEWRCKYCTYRSLCNRGVTAGSVTDEVGDEDLQSIMDADAGDDLDFDFDQIAEVEF